MLAHDILETLQKLPKTCNPNLLSDLAIAATLADTAAGAAAWNVRVNVPQLRDAAERATTENKLALALAHVHSTSDLIARDITAVMKAK